MDTDIAITPALRQRHSLLLASVFLLFSLLLAGCSERPDRPLRIGTKSWLGYEPLFLARQRFLDEWEVHLVEYPSASEVLRALRNKAIDGAALTVDEVLALAADGLAPRIVLVLDVSHGGDAILGQPGTTNLAELAGQRVGVESGAMGAYVLSRALEQQGMDRNELNIVNLDFNEHEAAFSTHKVDAIVTFEPVLSRLLNSGAVSLFDSSQISGEIVDVLVIWDDIASQRQRSIRHLIEAWFEALAFMRTDPESAKDYIAGRLQLTTPQVTRALTRLRFPTLAENWRLIGEAEPGLLASTQRLMILMRNNQLLQHNVDVATLFEPGPLNKVQ